MHKHERKYIAHRIRRFKLRFSFDTYRERFSDWLKRTGRKYRDHREMVPGLLIIAIFFALLFFNI